MAAPLARYEGFLLLIGSVFAPLFGVMLTDHFVVRRRTLEADDIRRKDGAYWFLGGFSLRGLTAWIAGIVAYQAVTRLAPGLGATLPALAVAAAAYMVLTTARPRRW